jgi:hypothetical protein
VIGHLALQVGLVLLEICADGGQSHLFAVKVHFEIVSASELIRHLILHLSDLLSDLLHFFLNTSLESLDFLQIVLSLLQLNLQSGVSVFRVFYLTLLEGKFLLLVLELSGSREVVLAYHGLLHVLQQGSDSLLMIADLRLVSGLLVFEVLHELIDLALLLVQDLILLGLIAFTLATA